MSPRSECCLLRSPLSKRRAQHRARAALQPLGNALARRRTASRAAQGFFSGRSTSGAEFQALRLATTARWQTALQWKLRRMSGPQRRLFWLLNSACCFVVSAPHSCCGSVRTRSLVAVEKVQCNGKAYLVDRANLVVYDFEDGLNEVLDPEPVRPPNTLQPPAASGLALRAGVPS